MRESRAILFDAGDMENFFTRAFMDAPDAAHPAESRQIRTRPTRGAGILHGRHHVCLLFVMPVLSFGIQAGSAGWDWISGSFLQGLRRLAVLGS